MFALQPRMKGCVEIGHKFCTNEVFVSRHSPGYRAQQSEVRLGSCASTLLSESDGAINAEDPKKSHSSISSL